MWDATSDLHKALSSPDNIAIEDYRDEDDFIWIGRYMPRDEDALARSQQFILDVLKQLDPIVFSDEDEISWVGPVDREAIVKVRIAQNAFRKSSKFGGAEDAQSLAPCSRRRFELRTSCPGLTAQAAKRQALTMACY